MERISYSPLSFWNTIAFMLQKGARLGAAIKSMMQQWIGFSPKFLHEVRMWELTARAEIEGFDPHVIVTRGRGASFRTHAAMLRISKRPVWIANYHDPWPLAHYPEPYALVEPGTDRLLHHLHRVLSTADWITFPSLRLLEWFVERHPVIADKSSVLPHVMLSNHDELAIEGVADKGGIHDTWTLVHAGTLLGPRDPSPLIGAFIRLCEVDAEFRSHARLRFVGPVLTELPYIPTEHAIRIDIQNRRISYAESLAALKEASVVVVMEAIAEHSPFLPAKITDCLAAHKPVLLLTPRSSELARLFGPEYPYQARNGDQDAIEGCLLQLWRDWREHVKEPHVLDVVREYCSEAAVGRSFSNLTEQLVNQNSLQSLST